MTINHPPVKPLSPLAMVADNTEKVEFLLIGGGLASAHAAQTLRQEGAKGSILIIGEEALAPYHRPPLSKQSSQNEKTAEPRFVLDAKTCQELAIDLKLSSTVSAFDAERKVISLGSGESIKYDVALIATGASPTPLNIPGTNLNGVHYLRTFENALAIRADAKRAKHAVVIGGGFIGLEVVSQLVEQGIAVTLIETRALLCKLHADNISRYVETILDQHKVKYILDDAPIAIEGGKRVTMVHTANGQTLPCDMVVIGAGVTPRTEFLHSTNIVLHDGILVNEYLQTSDPCVYAAGDVANAYHPLFKQYFRVEHWDNAIKQGRLAARNMLGRREPFSAVSYFYSHIFDKSFNLVGFPTPHCERIDRGSLETGQFEAIYLKDQVPCAFFTLGQSVNTIAAEDLIRNHVSLARVKSKLSDPKFSLSDIPAQVLFILQGGGAFGAFECGAIQALQGRGIAPDVVAGVSIGAFNGAIMAGNPDNPAEALDAFWQELATDTPFSSDEASRRLMAGQQIAMFGLPGFFEPRWLNPWQHIGQSPTDWPSLYDFSAARTLLNKYVDFTTLKKSPIRLMVTAVDVQSSEVVLFDSYLDDLTVDHIVASGSLPPAFPWVTIDGRHFWDAGIVSNSPLQPALDRVGANGKHIYLIDLFSDFRKKLPESLFEVSARREEIIFSDRLKNNDHHQDLIANYHQLVAELMSQLPKESARRLSREPLYMQLMGNAMPNKSVRITRQTDPDHPAPKAYDFSRGTIAQLIEDGRQTVHEVLGPKLKQVGSACP
jgi:NADPH-dependent 2,4-dienoyl-CoA reductase/sulfur reductase-like enzyme/predicted acylesterase/phospholipase RssA